MFQAGLKGSTQSVPKVPGFQEIQRLHEFQVPPSSTRRRNLDLILFVFSIGFYFIILNAEILFCGGFGGGRMLRNIQYSNRGIAKYYINDYSGACNDWKKANGLGLYAANLLIKEYCK